MMRSNFLIGMFLFVGTALAIVGLKTVSDGQSRAFSADVLDIDPGSGDTSQSGRIFSGDRRIRLERDRNGRRTIAIYDLDRKAMFVLNPDEMTYFKLSSSVSSLVEHASVRSDFLRFRGKPCGSAYRRTKVGEEAVDGRMVEKWRCDPGDKPKYMAHLRDEDLRKVFVIDPWHVWYDTERSLMVRYVEPGGNGKELWNVRIGEPPEDLFTVPAGYTQVKSPLDAVQDVFNRR